MTKTMKLMTKHTHTPRSGSSSSGGSSSFSGSGSDILISGGGSGHDIFMVVVALYRSSDIKQKIFVLCVLC